MADKTCQDLRKYADLIRQLVKKENEKDSNWKWSVPSVSKKKAKIYWEYLDVLGTENPFFVLELDAAESASWLHASEYDGRILASEIVDHTNLPFLSQPMEKALAIVIETVAAVAHSTY